MVDFSTKYLTSICQTIFILSNQTWILTSLVNIPQIIRYYKQTNIANFYNHLAVHSTLKFIKMLHLKIFFKFHLLEVQLITNIIWTKDFNWTKIIWKELTINCRDKKYYTLKQRKQITIKEIAASELKCRTIYYIV